MSLLKNIWFKRAVAVIECLYAVLMAWLGYKSFFYDTSVGNGVRFGVFYIGLGIVFMLLAFYTRKTVLTSVLSIVLMFVMIPVLFLNIGSWWVIVPPMFISLAVFFASGASEGVKTVFGTIFLLGYILGALAFLIITNLFITKTVDKVVDYGVSESGIYRYYVLDTQNQSKGSTAVYIEPNNLDFEKFGISFKPTGYAKRKYYEQNHEIPTVEFKDSNNDGTEEEIYINGKRCDIGEFKWSFDPKAILL